MFYPEDFKSRVKKAYPNFEKLHRSLDNGDEIVGRLLDDGSYPSTISLDTILAATSLEELQEKAKAIKVKLNLYNEWCDIVNSQNPR